MQIENGVLVRCSGTSGNDHVVIPDTVTIIGESAFEGENLRSVVIPDTVTTIRDYAFRACHRLDSVDIAYGVRTIGHEAFSNCPCYGNISIPETVTKIGYRAGVYKNDILVEYRGSRRAGWDARISMSVKTIAPNPFIDIRHIYVNENNPYLCSVDNVIYTKDMSEIVSGAFVDFGNIPESVTTIGEGAFFDFRCFETITLPDSIKHIKADAFRQCRQLQEIILPEHLTVIESGAFRDCDKLKEVTIPDSVQYVGDSAFDKDVTLTLLHHDGLNAKIRLLNRFGIEERRAFRFAKNPTAENFDALCDEYKIQFSAYFYGLYESIDNYFREHLEEIISYIVKNDSADKLVPILSKLYQ